MKPPRCQPPPPWPWAKAVTPIPVAVAVATMASTAVMAARRKTRRRGVSAEGVGGCGVWVVSVMACLLSRERGEASRLEISM